MAWDAVRGYCLASVAGFGASSGIHTASLVAFSSDLPVLVEVIEDEAHVEKRLPIRDEMVTGGALGSRWRLSFNDPNPHQLDATPRARGASRRAAESRLESL